MSKISKILAKGVSLLNRVLRYVCVILLFFMMTLGTVDVIGRYLFNKPILGTLEVFEILLPAIVLLGLGYTQESRGHVSMELLVSHLSPRTKTVLDIFTNGCALFISLLILRQGWILTVLYWSMHRTIPTLDVPMFLPQLFVPLGALVLSFVLMVQMLECIIQLKKGN
ncbi:MAG: TRAP transporter small permease [Deltaproteobacteria bacterium]|nr:TRAP transporter small permease [Deltaproteobacteria bacterium]